MQIQCGALVDIAGLVDVDIATRFGQICDLVIVHLVGFEQNLAPTDDDLALQHGLQIGALVERVALQIGGQLFACRLRNGFFQQTAGAQHQGWRADRLCLCAQADAQHANR